MGDFVLTPEELIQLTGHKRSDAQCRELQHMRLTFKVRRNGTVVVLRAHFDEQLGSKEPKAKKEKLPEFNWAAGDTSKKKSS